MQHSIKLNVLALITGAPAVAIHAQQDPAPTPPVAGKQAHETAIHGLKLTDDYFWLRRKTDSAVLAYLEAENAYTTPPCLSPQASTSNGAIRTKSPRSSTRF